MFFHGTLKLSLPVVSLVWMFIYVIEYTLLATIEAHFANLCSVFRITIAIPTRAVAVIP